MNAAEKIGALNNNLIALQNMPSITEYKNQVNGLARMEAIQPIPVAGGVKDESYRVSSAIVFSGFKNCYNIVDNFRKNPSKSDRQTNQDSQLSEQTGKVLDNSISTTQKDIDLRKGKVDALTDKITVAKAQQEALQKSWSEERAKKPSLGRRFLNLFGGQRKVVNDDQKYLKSKDAIEKNLYDLRGQLQEVEKDLKSKTGLLDEMTKYKSRNAMLSTVAKDNVKKENSIVDKVVAYSNKLAADTNLAKVLQAGNIRNVERKQKAESFKNKFAESFRDELDIARLVSKGLVDDKRIDVKSKAIQGAKNAAHYIPVPGVPQAVQVLLMAAQYLVDQQKGNAVERVSSADKSIKNMAEVIEKVSAELEKSYSHKTNGVSPMDNLKKEGVESLASFAVAKMISIMGKEGAVNFEGMTSDQISEAILKDIHTPQTGVSASLGKAEAKLQNKTKYSWDC